MIWDDTVAEFNAIAEDGFQFSDIAEYGLALLEGLGDLFIAGLNFLGDVFNIGIGRTRAVGNRLYGGETSFGCPLYINRVEVCSFCLFSCFGTCSVRDDGEPYPLEECVEEAARNAAMAEAMRNETVRLRDDRENEVMNENRGFYETFNGTCSGEGMTASDCPVATPDRFVVTQNINKDGDSMVPTNVNMRGMTLQGDSPDLKMDNRDLNTGLDFTTSGNMRRKLQGGPLEEEDCEVAMPGPEFPGLTKPVCLETYQSIQQWYNNGAGGQAAEFAQGTAAGDSSSVANEFNTEAFWDAPTIQYGNSFNGNVYELSLQCTDESIFVMGAPSLDFVAQRNIMQMIVADDMPGIEIDFATELEQAGRTNFTKNWSLQTLQQSCLQDFADVKLSITDETGKISNELAFRFSVTVVPPELEFNGDQYQEFACDAAVDILPRTMEDLPKLTGGCLPNALFARPPTFTDLVAINTTSNGCSGYTISREWTITPPDPSSLSDEVNYNDAECTANLIALSDTATQTFTGLECSDPPVVPQVCRESPFRMEGYEDFSEDGFPRLDILPLGRNSFYSQEFLVDYYSGENAAIVYSNGESIPEKHLEIVSIFTAQDGELNNVSSLVEDSFFLVKAKKNKDTSSSLEEVPDVPTMQPTFAVPSPVPSFFPRPSGPPKSISNLGLDPDDILGECEGDCDNDSDCGPGLYCFQRNVINTKVPGCEGGDSDATLTDYCVYRELPKNSKKSSKSDDKEATGPGIKHTQILPPAFREYSELCTQFVVMQVNIGDEMGHVCFHAECSSGGTMAPAAGMNMDDVAFLFHSVNDAGAANEKLEMMDKLENGPRVTTWESGKPTKMGM